MVAFFDRGDELVVAVTRLQTKLGCNPGADRTAAVAHPELVQLDHALQRSEAKEADAVTSECCLSGHQGQVVGHLGLSVMRP
jgi:hypothetical protein